MTHHLLTKSRVIIAALLLMTTVALLWGNEIKTFFASGERWASGSLAGTTIALTGATTSAPVSSNDFSDSSREGFGISANPFAILNCKQPIRDPNLHAICNPSDHETGLFISPPKGQTTTHFEDVNINISHIAQGKHAIPAIASSIILISACRSASADAESSGRRPECEESRLRDSESRLEAALIHANASGTSKQAEDALALWRMHEANRALENYVLVIKADGDQALGPDAQQARARLLFEIEKLRDFISRRRFPDESVSNHAHLFDGLL